MLRIIHRITADTKAQSVSSVSKQAICSLNVLANRSPRPKKDRQHVRLAEDSEELRASDSEDGFQASIFSVESKTHHLKISAQQLRFLCGLKALIFKWKWIRGQQRLS